MARGAKGSGRPATRGGRRAQTDVEESMADCIAEVDDVTAGLDAALPAEPATAPIPETVLRLRLDKSKKAEATAIKEKELMQKRLSDVEAQLELAKANVGPLLATLCNYKVQQPRYSKDLLTISISKDFLTKDIS